MTYYWKPTDKLFVTHKGEPYPDRMIPFYWNILNAKCECEYGDISVGQCRACNMISGVIHLLRDLGLCPQGYKDPDNQME